MDTRQLRYFTKVYEERNLSRAAELCNVSQSAVSFQIAKLEDLCGAPLFIRDRRGMSPTAAAELLYRHALPLLKGFTAAEESMRQHLGELSGDFAVGLAYSVVKVIGAGFLQELLESHPKINLSLTESIPSSTLVHVLQNEIDLAMTFNPPSRPELACTPILHESLVFIGRPDVIGMPGEPISIEEILTKPLIMYRQFAAAKLDGPLQREINARARVRMNSFQAIGFALKNGAGGFIGSKLYSREMLEAGDVVMRPISGKPITRTLSLVELSDRPASFVSEMISSLLVSLVTKAVAAGEWDAEIITE